MAQQFDPSDSRFRNVQFERVHLQEFLVDRDDYDGYDSDDDTAGGDPFPDDSLNNHWFFLSPATNRLYWIRDSGPLETLSPLLHQIYSFHRVPVWAVRKYYTQTVGVGETPIQPNERVRAQFLAGRYNAEWAHEYLPATTLTTTSTMPVQVDECPICLEPHNINSKAVTLPCGHMWGPCIHKWLAVSDTCPYCRHCVHQSHPNPVTPFTPQGPPAADGLPAPIVAPPALVPGEGRVTEPSDDQGHLPNQRSNATRNTRPTASPQPRITDVAVPHSGDNNNDNEWKVGEWGMGVM
ncbi:hypothetical protein GGR57DRAFT_502875 [Xylariaceae sp. FL1272]|nr:hypothetical protein GGR57DRAFT_502875 [Xylariaceae sp. FL1272]